MDGFCDCDSMFLSRVSEEGGRRKEEGGRISILGFIY